VTGEQQSLEQALAEWSAGAEHTHQPDFEGLLHLAEIGAGLIVVPLLYKYVRERTKWWDDLALEFTALTGISFMIFLWLLFSRELGALEHFLAKGFAVSWGATKVNHHMVAKEAKTQTTLTRKIDELWKR
jgi:hypothetical protein